MAAGVCSIGIYAVHGILDKETLFGVILGTSLCCISVLHQVLAEKKIAAFSQLLYMLSFFVDHLVLMWCGLILTVDLPEIHFDQLLVTKS